MLQFKEMVTDENGDVTIAEIMRCFIWPKNILNESVFGKHLKYLNELHVFLP